MDFMQFEDDGRTLTCRSASSPATPGTNWWWLEVSGENQRYAAFRTEWRAAIPPLNAHLRSALAFRHGIRVAVPRFKPLDRA